MSRRPPSIASVDFDKTPFVAIWETTRSCDLACRHCRAEAIPHALPGELTTDEGKKLLDELASMGTPICVLSGGDPAKRADLPDLVRHGNELGMRMATIPAATPLLTRELVVGLKDAGLAQMAVSLDGPTAEIHDSFRQTPGAFDLTMRGIGYANDIGMPLQINTTFSGHNWQRFDEMADLVRQINPVFWEVFFLVPTGRGKDLDQMNGEQFEELFGKLAAVGHQVSFIVKITEAPHYRRYLMQRRAKDDVAIDSHPHSAHAGSGHPHDERGSLPEHMRRDFGPGGSIGLAPKGVNSGNGFIFVSHDGDIFPSGFLPLTCGNVKTDSVTEVYRNHKAFRELRDPDLLKGKCGICEYRYICGGSRARAYAMTGDYLEDEPFCVYVPQGDAVVSPVEGVTPQKPR
jgi:radical SAM protein